MARSLVSFTLGLVLLVGSLGGVGCTQVSVTPSTRGEYRLGELQVLAEADFDRAYAAAKRGLKDAGLFMTRDDRKVVEAELNGRDSADTLVIIKVKEVGRNRTSVKIRYGLNGDLASAQRLYAEIEKRL